MTSDLRPQTQKFDEVVTKIEDWEQKAQRDEMVAVTLTLLYTVKHLENCNEKLAKSVQVLENQSQNLSSRGDNTPNDRQAKWQSECQKLMLNMAEKLDSIDKNVGTP